MIGNLQVLRGIAALGVVFYHTNVQIDGMHSDLMGVAIFFVISGFIMVHITRESADNFLARRMIRIVPLYWIFTLATVIWFGFGFANPTYTVPLWASLIFAHPVSLVRWFAGQALALLNADTAVALIRSLFFWPTAQDPMPVIAVGWTLNIEMFFYCLFAIALLVNRGAAPLLAGMVLLCLFALNRSGLYPSRVLATYGHDYVVCFVLGMAAYYLWRCIIPVIERHRGAAIVISIAVLICWPFLAFLFARGMAAHYIVAPLVVLSILALHSAGVRTTSTALLDFGGASYSLYLIHIPILETVRAISTDFPMLTLTAPAGFIVAICVSCGVAIFVYRNIELPILAYLRRRLKESEPLRATAPAE